MRTYEGIVSRYTHVRLNHMHSNEDEGYAVAQLAEALRYKPEGRGFDFRRCH